MHKSILVAGFFLAVMGGAHAQTFTKATTIELAGIAGTISVDAYSSPWESKYEFNPVARAMTGTHAGRMAYFGGAFGGVVLGNKLLSNHRRLRQALNITVLTLETGSSINNIYRDRLHHQLVIAMGKGATVAAY